MTNTINYDETIYSDVAVMTIAVMIIIMHNFQCGPCPAIDPSSNNHWGNLTSPHYQHHPQQLGISQVVNKGNNHQHTYCVQQLQHMTHTALCSIWGNLQQSKYLIWPMYSIHQSSTLHLRLGSRYYSKTAAMFTWTQKDFRNQCLILQIKFYQIIT